jgi:hypothetical protein
MHLSLKNFIAGGRDKNLRLSAPSHLFTLFCGRVGMD